MNNLTKINGCVLSTKRFYILKTLWFWPKPDITKIDGGAWSCVIFFGWWNIKIRRQGLTQKAEVFSFAEAKKLKEREECHISQ